MTVHLRSGPREKSEGEKFGESIVAGYNKYREDKSDEGYLKTMVDPNTPDIARVEAFAKLSHGKKEQIGPILNNIIKNQLAQKEAQAFAQRYGLGGNPQNAAAPQEQAAPMDISQLQADNQALKASNQQRLGDVEQTYQGNQQLAENMNPVLKKVLSGIDNSMTQNQFMAQGAPMPQVNPAPTRQAAPAATSNSEQPDRLKGTSLSRDQDGTIRANGKTEAEWEIIKATAPTQRDKEYANSNIQSIRAERKLAAKEELGEKTLDFRKNEADRKYHERATKKSEEEVAGLRRALPKKESALSFARNAIESGNVGAFSQDFLANILPESLQPAFRSAKGAQLITASKENLLSNLTRVSAKAQNQWYEKRVNSMFPLVGQSKEANLTVQEMLEGETALEKAYLKEYDRIANEDMQKYGYVRKGIDEKAHKAIESQERLIGDRTSYRLKKIEEDSESDTTLLRRTSKGVPKGTPMTFRNAKIFKERYGSSEEAYKVAKKLGYTFPKKEEVEAFEAEYKDFVRGNG